MTETEHNKKVATLASEVRRFFAQKKAFRIYHGSTNSTRILSFQADQILDTGSLDKILSIDKHRKVAIVEPNVPMDKLVKATLQYGLLPPVVPEFPGITVGGGIQGGAGESSSFRYGFFSQTTNWVEYITGNGTVVKADNDNHADLFYGAAGSCGTLGVITAVEIQLIDAAPYVALTYAPVSGFKNMVQQLKSMSTGNQHDFVDGIMFSKTYGVMITGTLTHERVGKVRRFSRAHDSWFYLRVRDALRTNETVTEYVPIVDYLFRYDRGAFWVGKFAFELFGVPFNHFYRFLLNPILHTRKLYKALQVSGASQEYIVQDLTLPLEKAVSFMNYVDKKLAIYPLWICPVLPEPRSPLSCNGIDTQLAINIGVWGPRIDDYKKFVRVNRDIESVLREHQGKKWMYAHTYYTADEFWKIYDKRWYDTLRKKYHTDYQPDMYEKVVVTKHYPVNAKRGLFKTILGTAGLRID